VPSGIRIAGGKLKARVGGLLKVRVGGLPFGSFTSDSETGTGMASKLG
jgi:hypothetical protein